MKSNTFYAVVHVAVKLCSEVSGMAVKSSLTVMLNLDFVFTILVGGIKILKHLCVCVWVFFLSSGNVWYSNWMFLAFYWLLPRLKYRVVYILEFKVCLLETRLWARRPGNESWWGKDFQHTHANQPWGPLSLQHNGYRVIPGGNPAGTWR